MSIKLSSIAKIALGLAIMVLLLYKVGIKEIAATITTMNLIYLPAIIILFILGLFIGAYNLKILTDALKVRIKMGEMWRYYIRAWAFGMVIPGKVGEFSFVYLAKEHMSIGQATAVSVLDKLTTTITLCCLAFIGFFIFLPIQQAILLTGVTITAIITAAVFILTPFGTGIIKSILGKHREIFAGFSKTTRYLVFEEKKAVIANTAITFLKWGLTAVVTYLAFLSFGKPVSMVVIVTISATTMLLSLIPITMSGLGIKEGAAVVLYGLKGVPAEITISAHIILLMMNYLGAATIFLFMKK
ncbi:flippase-like domain-containing protein [Candidatus Woesearchaeota archaeon]|nr:flippase-like domain-containing protein [Candidatus Woesearchaeota archaeon]